VITTERLPFAQKVSAFKTVFARAGNDLESMNPVKMAVEQVEPAVA